MAMEDRNCEILVEYLKSILYDHEIRKPDLEKLDEPFRGLGHCMETLQENLNHLARQAQLVAAGDYSQKVSGLGEFSEAFNTMTTQLELRRSQLKEESKKVKDRAEVIEAYNELLVEMTRRRNEWVLVVDAEKRSVVYCNKSDEEGYVHTPECDKCKRKLHFQERILNWKGESQWNWDFEDACGNCYNVNSFPVEWRGRHSYVHIVSDVTKEQQEKEVLQSKAYYDAAFGVRNRRFFMEYMEHALQEKKTVTLCYLDMDGLKFVNDRFGHLEGDCYIRTFVEVVQRHFRRGDILARVGGDEFVLILTGSLEELAVGKLQSARDCFREENHKSYPVSFSYGIYVIDGQTNRATLEEIMQAVDASMYEFKRKYKEKRC